MIGTQHAAFARAIRELFEEYNANDVTMTATEAEMLAGRRAAFLNTIYDGHWHSADVDVLRGMALISKLPEEQVVAIHTLVYN